MAPPGFRDPPPPAEQLLDDWRELLGTKWGRRLAYHIVYGLCRVQRPAFDRSIKDGLCAALHQARAEGIRDVGLIIQSNLQKSDQQAYIDAVEEGMRQELIDATNNEAKR